MIYIYITVTEKVIPNYCLKQTGHFWNPYFSHYCNKGEENISVLLRKHAYANALIFKRVKNVGFYLNENF